ncbi:hypothetical protein A9Q93_11475 [Nonlabens dokdonensis]|uniref:DinB-like domain-containing protein n=1 Tax=Nonlabens dokdonensis TaxID=328515 RepID=A0A1Z8ALZ3_9FLAO|nr:DinB family protein [Nonlabens dokdonensis]OUS11341.1 hypothetical protein A9Q93_11475 [Nonlabens dokdonensis]
MVQLKDISSDEYSDYYQTYLSLIDPQTSIDNVLQESLEGTLSLLKELEKPLSYSYAANKWSIGQVLQHDIDTERVFAYRALRFIRKDATPLPGFDQDVFVANSKDLAFAKAELKKSIITTRQATIELFSNVTMDSLIFKGNASGQVMTARVIPFLIAGHNLHHENVIRERYLT